MAESTKPEGYPYLLIADNFPSGNAGQHQIQISDVQSATITLRKEGPVPALDKHPKLRNGWFLALSGVFFDSNFTYFYSYYQKTSHRFSLNELQESTQETQGTATRNIWINETFEHIGVWVARFYPDSVADYHDQSSGR